MSRHPGHIPPCKCLPEPGPLPGLCLLWGFWRLRSRSHLCSPWWPPHSSHHREEAAGMVERCLGLGLRSWAGSVLLGLWTHRVESLHWREPWFPQTLYPLNSRGPSNLRGFCPGFRKELQSFQEPQTSRDWRGKGRRDGSVTWTVRVSAAGWCLHAGGRPWRPDPG